MRTLIPIIALSTLPLGTPSIAQAEPPIASVHHALRGVVNLNQADEGAIEQLPGIGPAKAKQIVEFRRQHPFKKIEELTRIKGIGRKTFARLKPYLAVTGPTTLSTTPTAPKR